jgi:preprotein translocase subunit YajC
MLKGVLLQGGNAFVSLVPLLAIFLIFYMLIIRPEKKRRRQVQDLIASLKIGDKVVTSGGVYGTVLSLRDETLVIRSDQSRLEIARSAVVGLAQPGKEESEKAAIK